MEACEALSAAAEKIRDEALEVLYGDGVMRALRKQVAADWERCHGDRRGLDGLSGCATTTRRVPPLLRRS